jgi:uncharacterized protein
MGYEWDLAKAQSNVEKHGVSFEQASQIFDGPVLQRRDARQRGEVRYIAYGAFAGDVLAVVYTMRGANRRLISARRASREEREAYNRSL